ncbi:TQXA domain-containing protein [Mycobacterium sp. E1386]|uniref:thioester domain-containing protein n=1 Tax=Mycobacterium sp. E1386 TaxID=1834126 RepID=UPI0007FDFFE9|nr:thioester domain-containing protein [Mycobacterium sp. E1386]OBI39034.1 TQXA domain-containing protein [Mycobacterium sp. E1386]
MTVLSIPTRASAPVETRRRVLVRPATEVARMTRYRGGTYSHTVDTIVFADGSSARTDLIRVNPNLHAYSLDFFGVAPHGPSRYGLGSWSALPHLHSRGCEGEVDWVLRNSFPMRSTAELSDRLRAAGDPLGRAHISEHEAIAATQAAIWHFTNGLELDTRPLNVPVKIRRAAGRVITFEFDGEPQLGGYSVWVAADAAVGLKLQKSTDGVAWQDISRSQLTLDAGQGRHRRTLGVGSTLSASSHGGGGRGYRYYRLVATTEAANPTIDHVRFWLTGARHYRNADRVVHLYNYLVSGARKALRDTVEPQLVDTEATANSELIGPFQVPIPLTLNVGEGHTLVDSDGENIDGVVQAGTDFYVRPAPGTSTTTVIATTPQSLTGRVLTGIALEGASHRFTPIALTVPTDVAIEFEITWQADGSCADTA